MQDQVQNFFDILIIGDQGAGKTTLTNQIVMEGTFNQYPRQTILMSLEFKTIIVGGREYTLRFLDNSGDQSYQATCQQFYQQAD